MTEAPGKYFSLIALLNEYSIVGKKIFFSRKTSVVLTDFSILNPAPKIKYVPGIETGCVPVISISPSIARSIAFCETKEWLKEFK